MHNGMMTLRQDGWKNVLSGITTPAEILNVTLKEQAAFTSDLFKN